MIASTGLWILRFLASLLLAQHPALVSGELSGPRLFAFPVPMNLARSPLDILLTGLVLLGQAALLLRFSEQGKTLSWRRWAPVLTGALALPMAVWIVSREAQNSQMSLIEVSLEEHFLARSFVQVALLLILWAPLSLLAPLIRRRRQSVILAMLVALPAASLLTFLILTASFLRGQETLVERNLKLQVLDQEDDRIHTLDESRLSLMNDARLPAYLDHELGGGHGSNAAYRLWTRTELARMGYRSSLELFDAQGNLQGHFGIEMPPSVPAGPNPAGNLQPVDLEKVLFSTLSQQEEVYTCRWPVMEEGKVVGGLALYVSNGFDNIPLLRPSRPNWLPAPGHRETPPVRAILGEDPVAMAYDSDRRLLWTARPDPPPPPSRSELQALVPSGEWRTSRSAGHAMRLFYFRHGDILSALGYALSRPLQHLSRLFRLGPLLLLSGGSLLLFFFLILLP
ncbi:MAG: hypothetical protein ACE5ID_07655, partial [Acidobacteriota bacterium]